MKTCYSVKIASQDVGRSGMRSYELRLRASGLPCVSNNHARQSTIRQINQKILYFWEDFN